MAYQVKSLLVVLFALCVHYYISVSASQSNLAFTCPIKAPVGISHMDPAYHTKPNVNGAVKFMNGKIATWEGNVEDVFSPIFDTDSNERISIGMMAQMGETEALEAVESAKKAWNNGQGTWPQMSASERITALENVVQSLREKREEIVNVLMWEIAKTATDAAAEFDRTMQFIEATIAAFREIDSKSTWQTISGIYARVRQAAIGIMLCLGPFNYPFNETYATLIPALLAGNVVIMKIPTVGGLAHILTMEAYAKHLPPGALTFVSGPGRTTVSPMMKTGVIDILAFIGGSKAADTIIKSHPHPHRLKLFLQLEGKNLGIVTPDADIDNAVDQVILGSTSYNGQRCTAIKLVMVHKSVADEFVPKFVEKVNALKVGLPWEKGVAITPLPEGPRKIEFLESLISDAVAKGATVLNAHARIPSASVNEEDDEFGGGDVHGLLMRPAVVYPVTADMRLWHEEQFGPVIPIAVYSDINEVKEYVAVMPYGQQAAVFTSQSSESTPELVDALAPVVGRININTQCGRSPDVLPFSGRRSSALGTMSITEALEAFSIPVVVAGKSTEVNNQIMRGLERSSKFMKPL